MNYYNEFDPYPAQWLRNLIAAGHLPAGEVDERSIKDVKADELRGYTQCHFFAGIGGWSYALRLAGWGDDRPVWTGSCPCQPFSCAGKGKAQSDERHLWPAWFNLIKSVKPTVLFGEQVAGAIAHNWLDDAANDLEKEGYAVGAAVLPACSVGAPHKRDRLWFVAHADDYSGARFGQHSRKILPQQESIRFGGGGTSLPDPSSPRSFSSSQTRIHSREESARSRHEQSERLCNVADTDSQSTGRITESRGERDFWQSEPAVGRVANGIPARAHKLRAYGNAIVPQVAAEFIKAFMECRP